MGDTIGNRFETHLTIQIQLERAHRRHRRVVAAGALPQYNDRKGRFLRVFGAAGAGAGEYQRDMMSQPKVVAAVDVGSNSIRLLVAEVNGRGRTGELDRLVVPVMIGRDTFSTGRISNRTMRETADALKGFARTMKEYGVWHYRAIATSAALSLRPRRRSASK